LLYENLGHVNGGSGMAQPCGIFGALLISSPLVNATPITGWRMQEVDGVSDRPEVKTDFNDAGWTPVAVDKLEADQLSPGQIAVFRGAIELTAGDLKAGQWDLNLGRIDDEGWIYVNGEEIGRSADWGRPYSFDMTRQLHPGKNSIAVIVKNNTGAGGLGAPTFGNKPEGVPVELKAYGRPAGDEKQWWKPDFNDQLWEKTAIGENARPQTDSVLTWYRMNFQIQPAKAGVWVPWRLHLEATGNGFLYLNGHAIGRYWEAGPQHDFFLPECWLNFGVDQTNNLTLSLRPVEKSAAVQSATVEPYRDFAEMR